MTDEPTLRMRESYRARDDGDPDALMIVTRASVTQRRAYHADPDCQHVRDRVTTTISRRAARERDYWPCRTCVFGDHDGGGAATAETCPMCGSRLGGRGLTSHLPNCKAQAAGSALGGNDSRSQEVDENAPA